MEGILVERIAVQLTFKAFSTLRKKNAMLKSLVRELTIKLSTAQKKR